MENTEPKRYRIDTFDKLCNLATPENVERLALDLCQWLIYYAMTIEEVRKKHPKETGKKINTKIAKGSFVWVDDGKNDLLYSSVEDGTTGQIHKVEIKKPNP